MITRERWMPGLTSTAGTTPSACSSYTTCIHKSRWWSLYASPISFPLLPVMLNRGDGESLSKFSPNLLLGVLTITHSFLNISVKQVVLIIPKQPNYLRILLILDAISASYPFLNILLYSHSHTSK